jgi:hypothetical protein
MLIHNIYALFDAYADTKQARFMPHARHKSKLAGKRRSDASGDENNKKLTHPGIFASPPAAQFPHFPSSWDLVASELAGALGDACRTSNAPRLLVDLKVQCKFKQ